jgi:hypothetical protein
MKRFIECVSTTTFIKKSYGFATKTWLAKMVWLTTPKNKICWPKKLGPLSQKNSWFLRQRTKFFETTDFSVKSTDKSIRRTVFSRLERQPNFPVAQLILFFGVEMPNPRYTHARKHTNCLA